MVQTFLWRYRQARRESGLTASKHGHDILQSPVRPSAAADASVGGPNELHPEEQDAAIARGASAVAQASRRGTTDLAYKVIV